MKICNTQITYITEHDPSTQLQVCVTFYVHQYCGASLLRLRNLYEVLCLTPRVHLQNM